MVKANFVAKLTGLRNTWPSEEEACADKENKKLGGQSISRTQVAARSTYVKQRGLSWTAWRPLAEARKYEGVSPEARPGAFGGHWERLGGSSGLPRAHLGALGQHWKGCRAPNREKI